MEIIKVDQESQVREPHITYCGESPMEAANAFQVKFGIAPDKVYQKVSTKGKLTTYVPAPDNILERFYSGAFYGFNSSA
jgi:hypothetical protein